MSGDVSTELVNAAHAVVSIWNDTCGVDRPHGRPRFEMEREKEWDR